jgi:hypothetical protein
MDQMEQMALAALYPPVEALIRLRWHADRGWSAHLRIRHESWGWSEATVDHYEQLALPELMDVLWHMDPPPEDH